MILSQFYKLGMEHFSDTHVELAAKVIPVLLGCDFWQSLLSLIHHFEKKRNNFFEISNGFLCSFAITDDATSERGKQCLKSAAFFFH